MKLMVYSHDAFGLGNIRRMLAICEYLLETLPKISILVVSGSPALHSLRLPPGLDYIKLPCMGRNESGEVGMKYLDTSIGDAVKLRSALILTAIMNFKPDLFLVDKKPDGLEGELNASLSYLKTHCPNTKLVLLLRDILDRPEVTVTQWQRHSYYNMIDAHYDAVWVVGMPEIFDVCKEYCFPEKIARKTRFCGYIRREPGSTPRHLLRQSLGIQPDEPFVLITPGGGADGYSLVDTYLSSLAFLPAGRQIRSLIVSGSEMPLSHQEKLRQRLTTYPQVEMLEFTDDLVSYMGAADVVVAMGGYNTVSEIVSLHKRAIVVPRIQPVQEQWIRAEQMAALGAFRAIHPKHLTPQWLMQLLLEELDQAETKPLRSPGIDMNALPRIGMYLTQLLCSSLGIDDTLRYTRTFQRLTYRSLEVVTR
jgi:predicted glycosyltransferase